MLDQERRARRRVLRGIGGGIASLFLVSFRSLAGRLAGAGTEARRIVIPANAGGDVVFAGEAVVCREQEHVDAFRARCPHLGCQISREIDGVLVCPCHGSRFRLDGTVATGPATRPLERLQHSIDQTGRLIVDL